MKKYGIKKLLCVVSVLLLPACIDSVGLQRQYVASRDGCREMAEMKLGLYVQPQGFPVSEKEKNAMLLSLFSECMRGENWAVAKPKEPPKEPPPAGGGQQVAGGTPVPPVGNTLPISTAASIRPAATTATPVIAPPAPAGTAYMLVPVPTVPPQQAPTANPPASQPAPPVVNHPAPQPPKTTLRNKGIGVGVGPAYSLEKIIEKE